MEKFMNIYDEIKESNELDSIDEIKKEPQNEEKKVGPCSDFQSNLNMNKIRNIPHVDGNFSCTIFLKPKNSKKIIFAKDKIKSEINKIIDENNENFINLIFSEIKNEEYHISLTRNFYLKYHQIQNFLSYLKEKIKKCFSVNLAFNLFLLKNVKFFNNEQKTRFFLALEIFKNQRLKSLVHWFNEFLKDYNILPFHKVKFFLFVNEY